MSQVWRANDRTAMHVSAIMNNDGEEIVTIYDAKRNAKRQNSRTNSHPCIWSIVHPIPLEI